MSNFYKKKITNSLFRRVWQFQYRNEYTRRSIIQQDILDIRVSKFPPRYPATRCFYLHFYAIFDFPIRLAEIRISGLVKFAMPALLRKYPAIDGTLSPIRDISRVNFTYDSFAFHEASKFATYFPRVLSGERLEFRHFALSLSLPLALSTPVEIIPRILQGRKHSGHKTSRDTSLITIVAVARTRNDSRENRNICGTQIQGEK